MTKHVGVQVLLCGEDVSHEHVGDVQVKRYIMGVSLSEPHTSDAALQDVCVCLSVCLLVACGHIP